MKKMKLWMLAALLTIGGASVFTACKDGDEGGGTKENRKAKKALLIILDDVAPSVLHIMGLHQPKEMTGQCLISE
jgi:bisphosphoglycerate-independent phosphoglycerate mutase (AlkP superfamily)